MVLLILRQGKVVDTSSRLLRQYKAPFITYLFHWILDWFSLILTKYSKYFFRSADAESDAEAYYGGYYGGYGYGRGYGYGGYRGYGYGGRYYG